VELKPSIPFINEKLFTLQVDPLYTFGEEILYADSTVTLKDRQILSVNWVKSAFPEIVTESETDMEIDPSAVEKEESENVTLSKCLDLFTAIEKLGPDDPWYCSKCKGFRQATKKFDLWQVPEMLVIHLKRFYHKNKLWREKLDTFVHFPTDDFDLSPWIKAALLPDQSPPIYQLQAVTNHYGSLVGGHYTAFALAGGDHKQWYKFDDSYVAPIEESQIQTSAAYVLFYRKKNPQPTAIQSTSINTSCSENNSAERTMTTT